MIVTSTGVSSSELEISSLSFNRHETVCGLDLQRNLQDCGSIRNSAQGSRSTWGRTKIRVKTKSKQKHSVCQCVTIQLLPVTEFRSLRGFRFHRYHCFPTCTFNSTTYFHRHCPSALSAVQHGDNRGQHESGFWQRQDPGTRPTHPGTLRCVHGKVRTWVDSAPLPGFCSGTALVFTSCRCSTVNMTNVRCENLQFIGKS